MFSYVFSSGEGVENEQEYAPVHREFKLRRSKTLNVLAHIFVGLTSGIKKRISKTTKNKLSVSPFPSMNMEKRSSLPSALIMLPVRYPLLSIIVSFRYLVLVLV